MEKRKKRQHYVWERYLAAWEERKKLWCKRGDKNLHQRAEEVAHCRYFYKLKEMSSYDIYTVNKLIIEKMQEQDREMARSWIPFFCAPHAIKNLYDSYKIEIPSLEHKIDIAIHNGEENLHAHVEGKVGSIMAELRGGNNKSLYEHEEFACFAQFLGLQIMRTSKMKKKMVEVLEKIPKFNAEASFGLIRTILAHNIGQSIFYDRHMLRMTFLEPGKESEFITGDQPVLNTKAVGLPAMTQATDLELFYPLSPNRAVLMDFKGSRRITEHRKLDADETFGYNKMISETSYELLFARTERALNNLGDLRAV